MDSVMIAGSAVLPNAIYAQPEEDLIMRCIVAAVQDAGIRREDLRGVIAMTPRPQSSQHYQTQHVATRLRLDLELIAEFDISSLGMSNALAFAADSIVRHDLPAVVIFGATRESMVPTASFFENRTSRTSDASFVGPFGMAPIVWNALAAREMLDQGEASEADFAAVSVRLRRNAALNPLAFFRKPVTAEEVLASRMVASPLRLLMVSPRCDGAGALVLARAGVGNAQRGVTHLAQGMGHDGDNIVAERAGRPLSALSSTGKAIKKAFDKCGIDRPDIDVIEPWVPFSPMEMMVMRGLGFPRDYADRMAVSPSGGLVSRGHPILATGFYSLHEVVQQLRGEAAGRQVPKARLAMTVSESGNYNACAVDVFRRFDGQAAPSH